MKLQILQENLEKAISITNRFASTKAQLPILGNILISARKNKVFVSSTNLEISACVQVGAKVEEDGEISVPSKVISDLVSNLVRETVSLESEKEQLKISSAGFSSRILGMDSSDFPKIPNSLNENLAISLSKKDVSESLGKVVFASSSDETRPVLTGVLFTFKSSSLSMVATDGFRLSKRTTVLNGYKGATKSVVIPKAVLSEINRGVFDSDDIFVNLEDSEKQIVFGLPDTVLTSRLLEGEFPDFEKIIPKESNIKITLDKEEFLRAVKLGSIFAREASNVIKINILKDSLKVTAESGQAGKQETKVDAKIERSGSGDFEIAFNYRYLEDFLKSVTGEEVEMEFINQTSAGIFRDTSDLNYLHLIMQVKV